MTLFHESEWLPLRIELTICHAPKAYAWRQSGFCRHHPGPRAETVWSLEDDDVRTPRRAARQNLQRDSWVRLNEFSCHRILPNYFLKLRDDVLNCWSCMYYHREALSGIEPVEYSRFLVWEDCMTFPFWFSFVALFLLQSNCNYGDQFAFFIMDMAPPPCNLFVCLFDNLEYLHSTRRVCAGDGLSLPFNFSIFQLSSVSSNAVWT